MDTYAAFVIVTEAEMSAWMMNRQMMMKQVMITACLQHHRWINVIDRF